MVVLYYDVIVHLCTVLEPRGVDLLGKVPRCVCQKVREMGPFLT